ncbi:MAG: response regulator transcription factor [Thiobacillus sp.]
MDIAQLNAVILDLHRAGREVRLSAFQLIALELIGSLIPFDSAWWGTASANPPEIHHLHLHNCDASILETYVPYMPQDFMRAALIAHPGRSINLADLTTRAKFVRTALYQQVGKRYRIEWSLGTLLVEPVSTLQEFLTLWRHDPKRPFSEAERQTKEWLMPHIADAHRAARLREVLGDPRDKRECWAVADERGFLCEITPAFVHCLRRTWPSWQGSCLPEELHAPVREAQPTRLGSQRLSVEARGAYRFLRVSNASSLDGLSPREHEIVARFAQGETHAAIASVLGLSPATVRNHIARCYRKLAVSNKAELARRVLQDTQ